MNYEYTFLFDFDLASQFLNVEQEILEHLCAIGEIETQSTYDFDGITFGTLMSSLWKQVELYSGDVVTLGAHWRNKVEAYERLKDFMGRQEVIRDRDDSTGIFDAIEADAAESREKAELVEQQKSLKDCIVALIKGSDK